MSEKSNALSKIIESMKGKSEDIFKFIDTPEKAVSLQGEGRKAYLEALENQYGPVEKRAELSGKNLERIKEREATEKFLKDKNITIETQKSNNNLADRNNQNGRIYTYFHDDNPISEIQLEGSGYNSAELDPMLRNRGVYQKLLEDHAINVGEAASRFNQRNENSKKVWDRLIDQNLGQRQYGINENYGVDRIYGNQIEPKLNRSSEAAFDPRFKESNLPMAGIIAAPMAALSTAQEVNPLNLLGSIVNKYRGAQQAMADKIVETVNPYPKQKPDQTTRELGRMIIDPINLIGGPVGDAVMALDLMTPNKEK